MNIKFTATGCLYVFQITFRAFQHFGPEILCFTYVRVCYDNESCTNDRTAQPLLISQPDVVRRKGTKINVIPINSCNTILFLLLCCSPTRAMAPSFLMRSLDHTQRRTRVGRNPLDERSARRRGLQLTTHNTHNRQIHNLRRRAAADLRLRTRGHWDRPFNTRWFKYDRDI